MSWSDWNRRQENWGKATWGERRLRDMLIAITLQNEAILAKLENRPSKLSPEDQAKVDEIFTIETADIAKIDAAQKT